MCLGIPGRIVSIEDEAKKLGVVDVGGVRRVTNLACVLQGQAPSELVGEWVLVHVGFAMSRIDPREAQRTLELLAEMGEVQEELEAMRRSGAEAGTGAAS
ncbi:MAG TPA: HypC/HybG/HupF family hydrogenase formation chaperone [Myxococcales bacterium LLY-WYZ-16_1]|jgi:hydrogenase expression/formation protein HypC|nr:HypC/HybG/HupF family hydrogenase formation chaperone [Myxococcales bacterium LLY-WYZ-16_1]